MPEMSQEEIDQMQEKLKNMSPEELKGKYIIGEHLDIDRPTLWDRKSQIIEKLKER